MKFRDLYLRNDNRAIDEAHVERLARAIRTDGWAQDSVIVCDNTGGIIHGQHRYMALRRLIREHRVIPVAWEPRITVVVSGDVDMDGIAKREATGKQRWSHTEVIERHARLGNAGAQRLLEVSARYGVSVDRITKLLGNFRVISEGAGLTVEQVADCDRLATLARNLFGWNKISVHAVRCVRAYVLLQRMPGFDDRRMQAVLAREPKPWMSRSTIMETARVLVEMYNYRLREDLRIAVPADTHDKRGRG